MLANFCEIKAVRYLVSFMDRLAALQQPGWLKVCSFIIAFVVIGILLAWPKAMMAADNSVDHNALMLLLIANSGAFVHGIGYVPTTAIWRWLFTPLCCWPFNILFLWTTFFS